MTEVSDEEYLRRVELHFGRRRGGPLVLSPNDWRLLQRWQREGIPLRIVLRGINQAFDGFSATGPRRDRINSLRYCRQQVEAAWEDYRAGERSSHQAMAATAGLPEAARHLGAAAAACRRAASSRGEPVAALLESVAQQLEELGAGAAGADADPHALDAACNRLEERTREAVQATPQAPDFERLGLPRFSPFEAF